MWYFVAPEVVFGEDALSHLAELQGRSAFIVTDQNMVKLGFVDRVKEQLDKAGIATAHVFDGVEPDPSLDTVKKGSTMMRQLEPDWVVAVGGGSVMDAAKAMRVEYVRPDISAEEINPLTMGLDLSARCKLVCVSTTSGTGAEATWIVVLSDTQAQTKLGLGSRDVMADIAIVDPALAASMPAWVTADTGMDVLTHGIEGFTSTFKNDISDGLCIKAIQLVFQYLPRAVANGDDTEAREKMHNAACIAGLGFGNSMAALAHSLGHALGSVFHVPHGRAVGLYLPYSIEFIGEGREDLWDEIAHAIRTNVPADASAASVLAEVIRDLARSIKQPLSVREAGIPSGEFDSAIAKLVDNAVADSQLVSTLRVPSEAETEKLFRYAYEGKSIDF